MVFSWDTPSGIVNRSFTLPYAQTSQVMEAKEMLKELTNSQEKKEQTLPYLLDYRGVGSISIDTYGVDAFGSADVETAEWYEVTAQWKSCWRTTRPKSS